MFQEVDTSYLVDSQYFTVTDGTGFGSALSRYGSVLTIGAERDGDFSYGKKCGYF
jgi:hypothetical protein